MKMMAKFAKDLEIRIGEYSERATANSMLKYASAF